MEGRAIHTIFYKGIPVGEYSTERAPFIRMEDFEQIYALHIDRFDNEGKFEAEIRLILTFIQSFLETGIPEGIRRDVLETQTQSKNFLDLVNLIDEFTSDISIDKTDQRFFNPIAPSVHSGVLEVNEIASNEFIFPESGRGKGRTPSSHAGNFDKFTAVLEIKDTKTVLRKSDTNAEIGNVLVKPDPGVYDRLPLNEAICLTLAGSAGLPVMRTWLAKDPKWSKKHFVTERFGIYSDAEGHVQRDMIVDGAWLLSADDELKYSISAEMFFERLKEVLPRTDLLMYIKGYVYSYLIGNPDMHIKNVSFKYGGTAFALCPFYDIANFRIYGHNSDIALTIGNRDVITPSAILDFAAERGVSHMEIGMMCKKILENIDAAILQYADFSIADERNFVLIMRSDIIDRVEKMVNTIENMNRNQSDADCFEKDR
mgnify:FL=1